MDKTFTAYINNAGDEWVQVTISGSGALELTEEAIEDALSLRAERDAAYRKGAEDMRERAASWIETQRIGVPGNGWEFAAAIRELEATP